jgi:hypothetical protein
MIVFVKFVANFLLEKHALHNGGGLSFEFEIGGEIIKVGNGP